MSADTLDGLSRDQRHLLRVLLRIEEVSRFLRSRVRPHERQSEGVVSGPLVEWEVDDLPRLEERRDDFDGVLRQLRSLALGVHEVERAFGSQEEVPFDISFARHVEGNSPAQTRLREMLKQGVVKGGDGLCVVPDDNAVAHAVTDNDLPQAGAAHDSSPSVGGCSGDRKSVV